MPTDLLSPQQQLFSAVYVASEKLGYETFDYLPAKETEYPFVYVGEQFEQDRRTKRRLYGDVQQTIHVYHDYRERGEVTTMVNNLKVAIRSIKKTDNFQVSCKGITGQTLIDDSTAETLIHGIIEVDFTFN